MIEIRQATVDDLPHFVRLDQEIFGAYGADEEEAVIRARVEVFPEGCAVLEDYDDRMQTTTLIGYLTTEKWDEAREPALGEDPRQTHRPDGSVLNITTLAVDPIYQNRGMGKYLLEHAIEIARREGCDQIVLETARAEDFYTRHGFEVTGEREERGISLTILRYSV